MQSSLYSEEERIDSKLSRQAGSFLVHTLLALVSWLALMALGYALNPPGISQFFILFLSMLVTLPSECVSLSGPGFEDI